MKIAIKIYGPTIAQSEDLQQRIIATIELFLENHKNVELLGATFISSTGSPRTEISHDVDCVDLTNNGFFPKLKKHFEDYFKKLSSDIIFTLNRVTFM